MQSLKILPFLQVEAVDIDEGENARITYSIYHISNNGGNKFTIDPDTGVICELSLLINLKMTTTYPVSQILKH